MDGEDKELEFSVQGSAFRKSKSGWWVAFRFFHGRDAHAPGQGGKNAGVGSIDFDFFL